MINIDTRLMDLVQNKTINTDEFFILLCITKRINNKSQAFPSRSLLMKESNMSKDKVSRSITRLVEAGIISKVQRNAGKFSSNLYTIQTRFLSVFLNASGQEFTEENTVSQNTDTQIPCTEIKPLSINQSLEVLNSSFEVKNKQKEKPNLKFDLILNEDYQKLDPVEVRKLTFDFWTTKKGAKTEIAFNILLKTLNKMTVENQIKSLEQAIISNYSTVYEIVDRPAYKGFRQPKTNSQRAVEATRQDLHEPYKNNEYIPF